jgi:hypothetical protein
MDSGGKSLRHCCDSDRKPTRQPPRRTVRAVAAGVLLLLGTGASVAADDSMPLIGDWLVTLIFTPQPIEMSFAEDGSYSLAYVGEAPGRSSYAWDAETGTLDLGVFNGVPLAGPIEVVADDFVRMYPSDQFVALFAEAMIGGIDASDPAASNPVTQAFLEAAFTALTEAFRSSVLMEFRLR